MKKLLSLVIGMGLLVSASGLTGCSDDKKPAAPAAKDAAMPKDKGTTPSAPAPMPETKPS